MPGATGSDYGKWRNFFVDKSRIYALTTAATGTAAAIVPVRASTSTLYIQRILLSVTTDAAQTLTFQDDAGTPLVIAKSPSSPGLGIEIVADFGPGGIALTAGKNLDMVISGAGLGAQVNVEAYEKLTGLTSA